MTAETPTADGTENRQFERIPFRLPVRATIYSSDGSVLKSCHVLAHDLSGGGVSILSGRPVAEGQRIKLEMPDRERDAIACRVSRTEDCRYLVGCRFEEVSSLDVADSPS
jgi:hypothetical protein